MVKINWIEYENSDTKLKINRTTFNKELTLLVGRSGAGKTQILEAISTFCIVATNDLNNIDCQFNGAISFSIDSDVFEWTVCVRRDNINATTLPLKKNHYGFFSFSDVTETRLVIKSETLSYNKKIIFERNNNKLIMNNNELPKISNDFSLIYQYNSDDLLKKVYDCMVSLYYTNSTFPIYFSSSRTLLNKFKKVLKKCNSLDLYRESFPINISSFNKIYLIKETNIELYNTLLDYYKSIFSDIEDFAFKMDYDNQMLKAYVITNGTTVAYNSISAGMRKVISFLVDLLTVSNNNVVLIDEIENGLGVNCLDEIYNLLTSLRGDIQLIITSHHPYIINNVNPISCKIVDRKRNVITTYSSHELNLTNSHHDFYDLVINKLQYGDI